MRVVDRLYDASCEVVKTYTYKINNTGWSEAACKGEVTIVFKNGQFAYATYPFGKIMYTKAQWEVLEAISLKIKELSNRESV